MADQKPGFSHPHAPPTPSQLAEERDFVRAVLREEAESVLGLLERVGPEFHDAVGLLVRCAESGGTVLISGMGKSGLIGAKIAATLASLGIPSHAVHPAEAAHGDLGRFRANDVVVCISASGETDEVVNLAAILHQDKLPIIAITCGPRVTPESEDGTGGLSTIERLATVRLRLGVTREAGGPMFVAPTSSTTATAALGDALALAAARRRNFTSEDFARRHPGGTLGGLLRPITDVLRFTFGKGVPLIAHTATVAQALQRAAEAGRRPGAIVLVDPATGRLSGIFTDGDLRRLILRNPDEMNQPIERVMTRAPRTLPSSAIVRDAVRMVREFRQDEIPVVDATTGAPVGILDVQDLIAMRLVED